MSIPYMGSKRKSCNMIYRIISLREKKSIFVDLFCGGFAVGEVFLKNGWKVIANDKNKYITALLKESINGLNEKIVTKFVTREEYFSALQNKEKYDDWYIGYLMSIWSFGNNQRTYLFGKNVESVKKAGYELIFNSDEKGLLKLIKIPQRYIDGIKKQENWHKRRIALGKVCVALKTNKRLESLERLERLQSLESLEIYSLNYDKVNIPKNAVVYCDPPYKGTASYLENNFNHNDFWEYCRKLSKTNNVYISEYDAPEDFIPILSFNQKSTLQGGYQLHNNQPQEKVFIYKNNIREYENKEPD
jgi:site-specific DNA-adenine methylase